MATIDRLDIQIEGSAQKANVAINDLIKNLGRLANSLKIDTSGLEKIGKSLNLSEIGKSVKSANAEMKKISKSATEVAKEFQDKFKNIDVKVDFSKPESELRKFQKQAQTAENSLSRVMSSSSADKRIGEIERLSITLAQATNAVKTLENHMAGLQTAQPKLDFNATGIQNNEKELSDFLIMLNVAKNDIKTLESAFGVLSNAPESNIKAFINDLRTSLEQLKQSFPGATELISSFEKEIQRLQEISKGLKIEPTKVNVDTSSIEQAIIKMEEIKQKFAGRDWGWNFTGNFEQLKAKLAELEASLARYKQKEQNMISSGEIDVSRFEKLQVELSQLDSKINILQSLKERTEAFNQSLQNLRVPEIREENLAKLQNTLRKTEADTEKLRTKLSNAITMGKIFPNIDDSGFRKLTEEIALSEKKAEALRQKIKEVGNAGKSGNVDRLGNGLSRLSSYGASAGSALKKAAGSILNVSNGASKATRPINNMANSFKSLMRTILPILGIRQIFNWGKEAIETASDLTEVQNVVDVTFGDMAYKVEEFAETSIEKFGMSELALKQISSRFQAMGIAMGFPIDKMSDMSVELTGLAADMASFYNVSQEDVAKSLESIFTGTTRPMRQYGIDLTQATLQEWALKQGIDANVQSMSQAEKTMLRYQYVMANTGAAQGDFARTMNSWANQVRILKMNFQQLAGIVGGVLVNAFKPIVKAVNTAMSAIIAFAKTISNALGKIFGWTFEEGGGGLAQDFDDIADSAGNAAGSAGDIADATGDAAENVKKMQAGLRAFDELKVINMKDNTDGGTGSGGSGKPNGGSSGAGGSGAGGLGGDWVQGESILKKFESELDTLYKLGDYISETLIAAMEKIDWDSVYEKARGFGKGLADFLNGLFADQNGITLFGEIGKTIAGALNTAIYAALSFGQTFDFEQFGVNLADGINNFFATFDFESLADTLNTWVDGFEATIKGFFGKLDWGNILSGIGGFLGNLQPDTIAVMIGLPALKLFGSRIGSAIKSKLGTVKLLGIGLEIASFVTTVTGTGDIKQSAMASLESGLGTLAITGNVKVSLLVSAITFAVNQAVAGGNWLGKKWLESILNANDLDGSKAWEMEDVSLSQAIKFSFTMSADEKKSAGKKLNALLQKWAEENQADFMLPIVDFVLLGDTELFKKDMKKLWDDAIGDLKYKIEDFAHEVAKAFINAFYEVAGGGMLWKILFGDKTPDDIIPDQKSTVKTGKDGRKSGGSSIKFPISVDEEESKREIGNSLGEIFKNTKPYDVPVSTDGEKDAGDIHSKISGALGKLSPVGIGVRGSTSEYNVMKPYSDYFSNNNLYAGVKTTNTGEDVYNVTQLGFGKNVLKTVATTTNTGDSIRQFLQNAFGRVGLKTRGELTNTGNDLRSGLQTTFGRNVLRIGATVSTPGDTLYNQIASKLNSSVATRGAIGVAVNAVVTNISGGVARRANGGVFKNGIWKDIPQYAVGGFPSHGTIFAAGEAGPEIVGHVGGRTEVLNQSQLASTMYSAVVAAMEETNRNSGNQQPIQVFLDGKVVFDSTREYARDYFNRTGRPAYEY